MTNEQQRRHIEIAESRMDREPVLVGTFGLQDRPFWNLGLVNSRATTLSRLNCITGERFFAINIQYPVRGMGLEYFLHAAAPYREGDDLQYRRELTVADMQLSYFAGLYEEDNDIYEAHKNILGFREYDEGHNDIWKKEILDTRFDDFFTWRDETKYIDAEAYIKYLRSCGYISPHDRRYDAPLLQQLYLSMCDGYDGRFIEELEGKPLTLIDPRRGLQVSNGRTSRLLGSPKFTSEPSGLLVATELDGIATMIQLGDKTPKGFYQEINVDHVFPEEYKDGALHPIIAWKEKHGKRTFLKQSEVTEHFPEIMEDGSPDVMLGRVALTYFQPWVDIPKRRGAHGFLRANDMGRAQLPVLVSMPDVEAKLLATETVHSLEKRLENAA